MSAISWREQATFQWYDNGDDQGRFPLKLQKNKIFWRKIVIFHTKYPKNFALPSARRNFFKCAPLAWNPGSAPEYIIQPSMIYTTFQISNWILYFKHFFSYLPYMYIYKKNDCLLKITKRKRVKWKYLNNCIKKCGYPM